MFERGDEMARDDLVLHRKKYKGDDGHRVFSVRLQEKTVLRLDELSEHSNRSRNELIGLLLNYALDRCVIEDDAE